MGVWPRGPSARMNLHWKRYGAAAVALQGMLVFKFAVLLLPNADITGYGIETGFL